MGPLAISFAAPAALLGLVALPLLYLLLRVTPPRPREIVFPPIRLLADVVRKDETPAKTPWWLLLLRLSIAAAAILAMSGPAWSPSAATPFSNAPLLIAIDDGWPAAPTFEKRLEAARAMAAGAARAGAAIALLTMSEADADPTPDDGARIDERLRAVAPKPFIADRGAAAARVRDFVAAHRNARIVWIADGLEQGEAHAFASTLQDAASRGAEVEILADAHVARALVSPANHAGGLSVEILRAARETPPRGAVSAFDAQGRVVAQAPFAFGAEAKTSARFDLPIELRNEIAALRVDGEASAGAVALLDGRSKVRRVAVLSGASADLAQPLLAPQYYLDKALAPFAEVRQPRPGVADPLLALLDEHPNIVTLADVGVAPGATFDALTRFVEDGGVLLRFAGPHLANADDAFTPVRLRRSGRVLGGAMSWETPKKLAPFEPSSPFFGLAVPDEVTVTRQVLAEPEPGLPAKTWAALTDGTPLVTAERRGKGLIVLFHVSA
ncbi:MAG: LytTR family transcriptional regulator, partial [Methylocystaceae bacterium]